MNPNYYIFGAIPNAMGQFNGNIRPRTIPEAAGRGALYCYQPYLGIGLEATESYVYAQNNNYNFWYNQFLSQGYDQMTAANMASERTNGIFDPY